MVDLVGSLKDILINFFRKFYENYENLCNLVLGAAAGFDCSWHRPFFIMAEYDQPVFVLNEGNPGSFKCDS